jgi:hypothetical protein
MIILAIWIKGAKVITSQGTVPHGLSEQIVYGSIFLPHGLVADVAYSIGVFPCYFFSNHGGL